MKGKVTILARSIKLLWKKQGRIVLGLSMPGTFLLIALACNLPSRQAGGLVFPTSQSQPTAVSLALPTRQPTLPDAALQIPGTLPTSQVPNPSSSPFPGLLTATPGPGQAGAWVTPVPENSLPPFTYITQPGDSLAALASRFGVRDDEISPAQPGSGFLTAGQQLSIPNRLGEAPYPSALLPDGAVVYSPQSAGFSIEDYIAQAGGYLSTYQEQVEPGDWESGAEIVRRVALENSINPQLLLAFLEFRSGWVRGQPVNPTQVEYPIGFYVPDNHGLAAELSMAATQLNIGYYGWRAGTLADLIFPDYTHVRVSPALNAGSVALQTLVSKFYRHQQDWVAALYGPKGVMAVYDEMFGDPWQAAARVGPLFPSQVGQPILELPFAPGELWSLTSGPHLAWKSGTPRGALDFAPITGEPACAVSAAWVRASAPGMVVRSEHNAVALDLDGDGLEQTGWVLVYMHTADQDRVGVGTQVDADAPLGHPSCEGGKATGTHVHLVRKYNGEWLAADGPLPMVLSGWIAHARELSYDGTLEKDGQVVSAHPDGSTGSTIVR